jgi:hypothetical protein
MSPAPSKWKVLLGVSVGLIVAGLPLMNKEVYKREQNVHKMRDDSYDAADAKNAARDSRLSRKA